MFTWDEINVSIFAETICISIEMFSQLSSNFHTHTIKLPQSPLAFPFRWEYVWALSQSLQRKKKSTTCSMSTVRIYVLLATCFSCLNDSRSFVVVFVVVSVVDSIFTRFIQFLKFNFRFNFIHFHLFISTYASINLYIRVGWDWILKFTHIWTRTRTHNSYEKKTKIMT